MQDDFKPDLETAPSLEWPEEDLEYYEEEEEEKSEDPDSKAKVIQVNNIDAPLKNRPLDIDVKIPVNALGEQFLAKYTVMRDLSTCCYLYLKERGYWQEVGKDYLKALMMNCDTFGETSSARRANAVEHALDRCSVEYIQWNKVAFTQIATKDGIYDVVEEKLYPHRWDNYLLGTIPHSYNKDAKCPLWIECLNTWFKNDDEKDKILALQEFFGYILCLHAKYKKSLIILGESDTGKSVVCTIAEKLVGENARCSLPPEKMDDPGLIATLKGKMLNLVTELGSNCKISDGGFKQIVANEPIQINQKYVKVETLTPSAKHVFATNVLPQIDDASMGVFNRLLIIQFNHVIRNKDPLIPIKLEKEIEGIVAWAVEGAKRLIQNNGQFTKVKESEELIRDYRISQNPVLGFFEEGEYERTDNENDCVSTKEFLFKFNEWKQGKEWSANLLGRFLGRMGIKSGTKSVNGKVMRAYPKIRRKDNDSKKESKEKKS